MAAFAAFRTLVLATVNVHVSVQAARVREPFLALGARVQTLSGVVVTQPVHVQLALGGKELVADGAPEGRSSAVCSPVDVQASPLRKLFVAFGADERLLSGVGPLVRVQLSALCESLPAQRALERPLSGVTAEVRHEVLGVYATFPALWTPVLAAVHVHVLAQAAPRRETLVALGATVELLHGIVIHVTIHISFSCEPFISVYILAGRIIMWMFSVIVTISFRVGICRTSAAQTTAPHHQWWRQL